jgi:hypothetical protein
MRGLITALFFVGTWALFISLSYWSERRNDDNN